MKHCKLCNNFAKVKYCRLHKGKQSLYYIPVVEGKKTVIVMRRSRPVKV